MGAGGGEPAVRFGLALVPATENLGRLRELVRVADDTGMDLVGIQDHPYQGRFVDTWSWIPTLLAQTQRVTFFTDVANLPLRLPSMVAKAAATLDVLSGGRFELGLGGGAFLEQVVGYGGPRRSPGESVEAVEEAIEVIRLLWVRRAHRLVRRHVLPARAGAPRAAPRPPDRDLARGVQAADAAPRRSQGRRLAALPRGARPRRASRRQ
jgi:alkanesulfonate monooxygenase SsuD/methylene tetrahydromethanopterin reductase-like flavin-dependent oxidoreductase (luciferase family)